MHLITPFDFVKRYPEGRSVAIVGNAPSLEGYHLGPHIDSFDVIVRFNEFVLDGFEENIGSRTDIAVTNPYAETRQNPHFDRDVDLVLVISSLTRRGEEAVFRKWVGDKDVLFTYAPSLVGVADGSHSAALTTSTYALQLLWRILRPNRMLVTGFTMFSQGQRSHYWKEGTSSGLKAHDMDEESRIFCQILNAVRCEIQMTPDIAAIFSSTGIQPQPRIQPLTV